MNEKNIIHYLQFNKKIGVAFAFMPKEVQKWARKNSRELCCYSQPIESTEYKWMRDGSYKQINPDGLYALPDNFEPKGCWVEYDIKDGQFYEETRGLFYAWHEWSKCMSDNPRFITFGGWQYPNCDLWFTSPQVDRAEACYDNVYRHDIVVKPAIPIKIRFWKGE